MPINEPGVPTSVAQPGPTEHRVSPREVYGPPTPDPYSQRIGIAQANSNNLVPVRTIMDLANLNAENRDIAIAARRMARQWDVAPQVFFGQRDPRKVVSNITGRPVSMQEAQRFTNYYSPVALASMLSQTLDVSRVRRGSKNAQLSNPKRLGQFANVLSRSTAFDLTTGLAVAYQVSNNESFSPKTFEQNISMAKAWLSGTTGQQPSDQAAISVAVRLSQTGVAHTVGDVPTMLYGRQAVATSQRVAENIQSRITYGTPEERQKAYQEELAGTQAIEAKSGAVVPGEITPEGMLGPDYWQQVQTIQDQVRLENEAFQHSLVGKAIGKVGQAFGHVWNAQQKGLVDLGLGIVYAPAQALAALPGGPNIHDMQRTLVQAHQDTWRRIEGGQTVGDIVQQGWGDALGVDIPDWTGTAFDFFAQWETDPFVVGGKIGTFARAGRLLPELEQPSLLRTALAKTPGPVGDIFATRNEQMLARATERFQNYVVNDLPASRLSRSLFDAAKEGGVPFARRLDIVSVGSVADRTLDYTYMKLLRDEVLKRFPDMDAEAWQAWQDGMRAHFVGWGPPGSAAEAAANGRIYGMQADVKALADNMPEVFPEDFAQAAEFVHNPQDGLWHAPFTPEAPGSGWLSDFGIRRNVRAAITNERFTDTAFGRRVAALPNINPGRQMPLFGTDAEQYVLAHARRWTTFNEAEVRGYQAKALRLLGAGGGTERNLEGLITQINDEAFKRIVEPFHLTPEAELQLRSEIFDPIRKMNARTKTFGTEAAPEGGIRALDRPILESQLSNYLTVIDPVQVRSAIREYTGVLRRMRSHLYNTLRLDSPEIATRLDNVAHRVAVATMTGVGEGLNDFRHIWKALVIARPGYVPRVVLGDENLRFLSVTRSVTERTLSAEWWGATRKLEDSKLFTQEFKDAEGNVVAKVGLPGALEMNPLATGQVRESELLADVLRRTKLQDKAHLGSVSWDLLDAQRNASEHMNGWIWALNKQLPNSEPGRVALESVAKGEDLAATRERLLEWAKADNYVTLRQDIGVTASETQDWANNLATMVHSYTYENRDIARAALTSNSKDLRQVIENMNIPVANRPVVHGPTVAANTKGLEGVVGNKVLNKMYDTFVRWPESHMNRQPFYKAMKNRAERGYYALLQHEGIGAEPGTGVLTRAEGAFEPRVLNPGEDVSAIEASPDYLYHVTPSRNIESIRTKGVLPQTRRYGIPEANIPPEQRGGRAFVGTTPDVAMNATGSVVDKVLIRVPKADVPHLFSDSAPVEGSFFARQPIDATNSEILGADGAWHAIEQTGRQVPGITPAIQRAIDHASTNFALDQVSRVMFDFTKQSRFTELLQFLFPFPQPFFEGFQAWGHLLHRDPGIIGRANALYRAGVSSGWIKQDPTTEQTVVDLKPLRWAAVQMAAPFGMKDRLEGLDLVAPLTNFNMLASTTLRLPTGGEFGKIAGGVPILMPSLRPELQALAQWAFRNSNNEALTSYLFQYGPTTSFVPKPLQTVVNLVFPGSSENDNQHKALADSLLRGYQVNHVTFQYQGQTVGFDSKGNPVNEDLLLQAVKHDANNLFNIRGALALFSPAAPSIRTSATPYEQMWSDYLSTSPDYSTALDRWTKDHPDLWLVPIGKTFYDGAVVDPRTGKAATGPRLPASRLVMEMLNTPGIGDFMKRDKAWAGLLLIGLDPAVADSQDWPTFSRLVANGTFRYKTPEQFFGEGETGRVWREINDFYSNTWNPGRAAMDAKGLNTNDRAYTQLQLERRTFLTGLYQKYPTWVRTHLQFNQEGGFWDWPDNTPDIPTNLTIAQARSIVASPGFEGFPGVRALGSFMDLYDKTAAGMKKAGYTSILQDSAVSDGFTQQFANATQKIIDQTPGIAPYLSAMFGVRLGAAAEPKGTQGVGTTLTSSDILTTLPTSKYTRYAGLPVAIRPVVDRFDTKMNVLQNAAYQQYDTTWERSQRYLDLQKYLDGEYTQQRKVVNGWWATLGVPDQKRYLDSLATKPAIFYTAFDWHLMGENLNKGSIQAFQQIAAARIQISKYEDADPKYSSSDAYNSLNAQVAAVMARNKNFAHAVAISNDWTFPLRSAALDKEPGKVGHIWSYLITATQGLQKAVEGAGITGVSGGTDAQNKWYADTQTAVLNYVRYYTDKSSSGYSEPFAKSWQDLTSRVGSPIVGSIILPDTYYGPLGQPNYGK